MGASAYTSQGTETVAASMVLYGYSYIYLETGAINKLRLRINGALMVSFWST